MAHVVVTRGLLRYSSKICLTFSVAIVFNLGENQSNYVLATRIDPGLTSGGLKSLFFCMEVALFWSI